MTFFRFMIGCVLLQQATTHAPHTLPWTISLGVATFGWTGLAVHQGWRYIQVERKKAQVLASRQRTAELETELGYEPLNLHELDEILLDNKNKEPGT